MQLDWTLLLGPSGALVFCAVAVLMLWRRVATVDSAQSQRIATLEQALEREHEARLVDAKEYAQTLLEVARGTHRAIDRLEAQQNNRRTTGTNQRE